MTLKLKSVSLGLFAVCLMGFSTPALSLLTGGSEPILRYSDVPIYRVISAAPFITYQPATPRSIEYYEGHVEVRVEAEGNTCGGDPNTFGLMQTRENGASFFRLVVGQDITKPAGCAQFSSPTTVTFKIPVMIRGRAGGVQARVGSFYVTRAGQPVSVLVDANGGQVSVSVVN